MVRKRVARGRKPKAVPAATARRSSKPRAAPRPGDFYVVGMGGSAGSLEAFEQFFSKMPTNTGVAFVVVQHLDPTHKDIMPELLQRLTSMPVHRAEDGMKVKPNSVYVIPPNKDMSILHGSLQLLEPSMPRGLRMPIDFFFRHLADDQEERGIGIVFSGMGTDGMLGVKAIKSKLGMVMVQSVDSAKYDGMPRSAIETGLIDVVAAAEDLPARLVAYVRHAAGGVRLVPLAGKQPANALQKIFILLRSHTGHDFSFYKKNTVYRRIERRMSVHQLGSTSKYVRYLQENPQELDLLFKELLIGVTNFFRDSEAMEAFRKKALPHLLKDRPKGSVIRTWVPGCSTGEEAYSIAMIMREYLGSTTPKDRYKIQVFATDIDKDGIERARLGLYPSNITVDVSPERLQKFFTKEDDRYRVKKDIRDLLIFAPQDVIVDPPFTKLDVICCRNLLIYLEPELQKKLLPLFHYALNPGGVLFLGSSESIGSFQDLFTTLDNKWKIYRRRESAAGARVPIELPSSVLPAVSGRTRRIPATPEAAASVTEMAHRALLDSFTPPAVFVGPHGDILYINGRTGKYLEPAAGRADMNVFSMAREGLRFEIGSAVHRALKSKRQQIVKGLRVKTDGGHQTVDLIVRPFTKEHGPLEIVMVAFEDVPSDREGPKTRAAPVGKRGARLVEIEKQLQLERENLQTTIEECETTQEELKSANEELQSTNEELQSTNEELTTSKEELQSLNEELVTVNAELQNKVDELSRSNDDIRNLLDSTEIATIFLDRELHVQRFTSSATKIINLIQSDIGRPIGHIVSNLRHDNLTEDVTHVLQTLESKRLEMQTKNGDWYSMRIIPYRSSESVIEGVIITFEDINEVKRLQRSLDELQEKYRRRAQPRKQ
jgi:two-component system CheB/CheR fusion protein